MHDSVECQIAGPLIEQLGRTSPISAVGFWADYVSALSEARLTRRVERNKGLGRAFDKAVRRKPLAGAADAGCYGNSIDFCLKILARQGL
jgi:hypothetical protein